MKDRVACIFVDGENLRHSLIELFQQEFLPSDYLPRNANWTEFFDALVKQSGAVSRLRSYWYTVENIDFWPWGLNRLLRDPTKLQKVLCRDKKCEWELGHITDTEAKGPWALEKAEELIKREKRMKNRFDGWKIFQDGITQRFDAVEFRRAGSIHYNLFTQKLGKEKAVDVCLATDLLELRNIYDVAIIVSGDQDYVPAVQAVKNSGKEVVNVSFLKRDGQVLPGGARRLNQATDRRIEMSYVEMKSLMHLPSSAVTTAPQTPSPSESAY